MWKLLHNAHRGPMFYCYTFAYSLLQILNCRLHHETASFLIQIFATASKPKEYSLRTFWTICRLQTKCPFNAISELSKKNNYIQLPLVLQQGKRHEELSSIVLLNKIQVRRGFVNYIQNLISTNKIKLILTVSFKSRVILDWFLSHNADL